MQSPIVFLRTPYNYDMDSVSVDTGLACDPESMTKQEFKEECDINTIVRNFGLTGEMPESIIAPLQGDFTEITDYRGALHLVMEADAAFMEMPAESRERFNNDPARWVEFVSDPANLATCQELGLARVERPAEPLLVRIQEATPPQASLPQSLPDAPKSV